MTVLDPGIFDEFKRVECFADMSGPEWLYFLERVQKWRDWFELDPDSKATIDFETRSACDLKKHGAWIYSKHPTTQAMCMSYRLPGEPIRRWHMAHPQHGIKESPAPLDLFAFILAGGRVEAHNAFFETVIWENVMSPNHGWPTVPRDQWRCSAAKASSCSLPRDLEGACAAMALDVQKDMAGNRLMKKMSKPRKPVKAEIEAWMAQEGLTGHYKRMEARFTEANGYLWHEEEQDIYRLWGYCDNDIEAEEALSEALPDLSDSELEVWLADQDLNLRGTMFDLDMARSALDIAALYRKRLNDELKTLTGDPELTATRRQAVKDWLLEHENLDLPDTTADTLDYYLQNARLSDRSKRICEIIVEANRTSTRKYQAMLDKCDPDDWRARDLLLYHGAGTGRYSGKGIQVQNFPGRDLIIDDFVEAAADIRDGNLDWIVAMYGDDVMKFLSHALRGAIMPAPGKKLAVADYSAIEARCVLWEARAEKALRIFREGGDIYCDLASTIYGREITKKDKSERQFGKQAILGLGYEMGFVTFLLTCRNYNIRFSRDDCVRIMGKAVLAEREAWVRRYLCLDSKPPVTADPEERKRYAARKRMAARTIRRLQDARESIREIIHELALMKYTVDLYRDRYPEVRQLWRDQEAAAIRATREWEELAKDAFSARERDAITGPVVECHPVKWQVKQGFLHCFLPSGRPIRYRDPEVRNITTAWGEIKAALRYMSVDGITRKWVRTATYGGKIVENITQGIARDIMIAAFVRLHRSGTYAPLMSVHDELVCEVDEALADTEEFRELMVFPPPWAHGCPISSDSELMDRYGK